MYGYNPCGYPPPGYMYPPQYPTQPQGPKPEENLIKAMKYFEKLERRKNKKKGDNEKDSKRNGRMVNGVFIEDPKPKMFTKLELTGILMVAAFPVAFGQIYLVDLMSRMLK